MKRTLLIILAMPLLGAAAHAQSIYTTYSECPEGAVDLGITMTREDGTTYQVFWGECNVGASSPEQRGGYYAWGETGEKELYNWDNYAFGENVMTKYTAPEDPWGPAVRLELQDDVAHVELGGKWRMPTMGEWLALRDQCDWSWETIGEAQGYRVTSRVDPEKSIFLPYGGMKYGDVMYDWGGDRNADYWSSSLCISSVNSAWCFTFTKYLVHKQQGASYRYYGFLVRPVSE